jgi:uncharacterized phiE125 gp8 family phage protein
LERPAATALVPLPTLKRWLYIEHSADDELLERFLRGAIARIDGPQGIGFAMMRQTWRKSMDAFQSCIFLPGAPVKSIADITYIDPGGVARLLDPGTYYLDAGSEPARLVPAPGKSWPATANLPGAVKIDYFLGEDDPDDVPGDLMDAVALLVGHRNLHREAASDDGSKPVPLGVEWILNEHARCHVAA